MAAIHNIKGTSFASFSIGKQGPTIHQGTTAPGSNQGSDGDFFIRTGSLPRLYQRVGGSWVQLESTQKVIQVKSSDYQTALPDQVIFMDSTSGPRTVTLGNTSCLAGKEVVIKDSGGAAATNNITVVAQGGQTIDGQSSIALTYDRESVKLISDGTNWFII